MPALSHRSSIYDLTARDSASIGLPHAPLLIEAFKAILDKDEKLPATFDESSSTKIVLAQSGVSWRVAIHGAISALERNWHFLLVVPVSIRRSNRLPSLARRKIQTTHPNPKRNGRGVQASKWYSLEYKSTSILNKLRAAAGRKSGHGDLQRFQSRARPYSQTIQALLVAEG